MSRVVIRGQLSSNCELTAAKRRQLPITLIVTVATIVASCMYLFLPSLLYVETVTALLCKVSD